MKEIWDKEIICRIVETHRGAAGGMLSILRDIQTYCGYLPKDALRLVADVTGRSLVDIYGLATFHDCFDVSPRQSLSIPAIDRNAAQRGAPIARCPRCNHSLMDPGHRLGNRPSVRVTAAFGLEHGWFCFALVDGEYTFECEHPFPSTGEVNFFCPHCHAELLYPTNCGQCDAPMVPSIQGRIVGSVCSNTGCTKTEACATRARATA